jgi:hypothetical protein
MVFGGVRGRGVSPYEWMTQVRAPPAVWARHTVTERFDDAAPPAILMVLGLEDAIVPMAATHALARGLGAPVLEPVLVQPGVVVSVVPPVADNVEGVTLGLFQFDRVRDNADAPVKIASHLNTSLSYEAKHQARHFFETWLSG